jgi:hypothetical protein
MIMSLILWTGLNNFNITLSSKFKLGEEWDNFNETIGKTMSTAYAHLLWCSRALSRAPACDKLVIGLCCGDAFLASNV